MAKIRRFRLSSPAPDGEADGAGTLRRQLQTARGRHRQPRHLPHNSAKAAMAQAFLKTRQHRLFVAGLDIDDPVRGQTDLRQGRREQVGFGHAP